MKKIFTLFFTAATIVSLQSQVANFTMSPDSSIVDGPATEFDILQLEINIKNTDAKDRIIVWERTEVNTPFGWTSTVCDPIACRPSSTKTAEFELKSNESYGMLLDVSTEATPGTGYYKLRLYEKGKPDQFFEGRYRFNAKLVSTSEEWAATQISLYPNPTSDFFYLKGEADLTELQLLSLDGRVIKTYPFIQNEIYSIDEIRSGAYMVNLIGKQGKHLATKKLMKI
ncbi:MAG: T9SS type A sorting domain-containing protein [Saprospiraceae bacterium]